MDILSLLGILLAIFSILIGQYFEGGVLSSLVNGPALLIVLGGTLGAIMLATPWPIFFRALRIFPWVFFPPSYHIDLGSKKIVNWSIVARKEGLLGLEVLVQEENDPFMKKALQLLADGIEPENLRTIMEVDISIKENIDIRAARVYEGMGGYSPTIGILGAVLGLIHVMGNLSDPSRLGSGIAVSFVATIYGIGFANLFYIPVGHKIRELIRTESHYREMILDGLVAIAEGENPHNITLKLEGYMRER